MAQQQKVTFGNGGLWVLTATILGSSLGFLNTSMLNVALDSIQRGLEASATEILWVVNSFLLMLAAFILIGGSLGDHFGRSRVFGIGTAILALASVACALAPNPLLLIIGRAVQGFGAALIVPGSLAIITAVFVEEDRGRAIGLWAASSAITTMIGPMLGGFLAGADLWRGIFLINIPLALIVLYALRRTPETRDDDAPAQLDYPGALTLAASLGALTFGALRLGDVTALNQRALVGFAAVIAGLVLVAVFVVIERRSDHPMVRLDLFKSPVFSGANLMTGFLYAGLGGALVFVPLNLIQIQHYDPVLAAVATLPLSLMLAILSPLTGAVLENRSARIFLIVGPLLAGLGFFLLALPGVTSSPWAYWSTYFPAMLVLGTGMGLTVTPLTNTVMSAAPSEHSGTASGINNAVSRTAQALATGILGAVMIFVFTNALLGRVSELPLSDDARATLRAEGGDLGNATIPDSVTGETRAELQNAIDRAFIDGFRLISIITAVLAWASGVVALLTVKPEAVQTTDEDADAPDDALAA